MLALGLLQLNRVVAAWMLCRLCAALMCCSSRNREERCGVRAELPLGGDGEVAEGEERVAEFDTEADDVQVEE